MSLEEYLRNQGKYFIAMEYYRLILNRTFLILITQEDLIGLKINGMISAEHPSSIITNTVLSDMIIDSDRTKAWSYAKSQYLDALKGLDINKSKILQQPSPNFKISRQKIERVNHDTTKKWGMGNYPHDGKIHLFTQDGQKRAFIILGNQSGKAIRKWLEA